MVEGPVFPPGSLYYQTPLTQQLSGSWPEVAAPFSNSTGPVPKFEVEPGREKCSVKLTMDQFAKWVESLLAFHAFLKYGGDLFADPKNRSAYNTAVNNLFSTMIGGFGRAKGTMGFKLQKLVECFHFGKDHTIYGPAVAYNTDTGERGLKKWAKAPAATAQNRSDHVFKAQVCRNLLESEMLSMIVGARAQTPAKGSRSKEIPPDQNWLAQGRQYIFVKSPTATGAFRKGAGANSNTMDPNFPKQVSDWFVKTFNYAGAPTHLRIQIITELTIGVPAGDIELLRAHPNFGKAGPWYDFVDIDYGTAGGFPARCACFFEWPANVPSERCEAATKEEPCSEGQLLVLIHESDHQRLEQKDAESMLYSHYTLQGQPDRSCAGTTKPIFRCVFPHAINGRVYAVDPNSSNGGIFWKEKDSANRAPPPFDIIKIKDRQSIWPMAFLATDTEKSDDDSDGGDSDSDSST